MYMLTGFNFWSLLIAEKSSVINCLHNNLNLRFTYDESRKLGF